MSALEEKAAIMRDLGMTKISYHDGKPWPSDDELINPDLTKDEIAELRKKSSETLRAHQRVENKLYPPEQHYEVFLNYIKLQGRLHRALRNKSRGKTL